MLVYQKKHNRVLIESKQLFNTGRGYSTNIHVAIPISAVVVVVVVALRFFRSFAQATVSAVKLEQQPAAVI